MPRKGGLSMSRSRHGSSDDCQISNNVYPVGPIGGIGNGICSFPTLVILILIILQFSKKRGTSSNHGTVDNSILFIIALFYLSCGNLCRR